MFTLSRHSKDNRQGVDDRLIEISDRAIQLTLIDFGHGSLSGLRSADIQHQLYMDGKSKCDGYTLLSNHQSGKALDFYAYVDGKASWKPEHLAMVGAAFLQAANDLNYQIKWGGLWQGKGIYGWDMPHIELME